MTNDIDLATALVRKWHAGQAYGPHPYTTHVFEVMASVVAAAPNDERLAVVALLHDILEDTEIPSAVLVALFDDKVVDAVFALTKTKEDTYDEYIARVKKNPMAVFVKRHDAMANLRNSLLRNDLKRVKKYAGVLQALSE